MRAGAMRAFRSLHAWVGLAGALVLFVVFVAGSLTVFRQAVAHWERPAARGLRPEGPAEAQRLLEAVLARHPELHGQVSVLVPGSEHPRPQAYWFDATRGEWVFHTLEDVDGPGSSEHETGLSALVNELHSTLLLGKPGAYLLGSVCLLYLLALLSGLLLFLPQFRRRWISVSTRGGPRRFWGDLHGVIGLMNLPFHLVFAGTGFLFVFFMLLVAGLDATLFQRQLGARMDGLVGLAVDPRPSGIPAPTLDVASLLAQTRIQAPELEVEALRFHHHGDRGARVEAMGHQPGGVGTWGMVLLDGTNGRVLERQVPGRRDGNHALLSILYGLHFGDYGGVALRWIYFALGLAGAGLFLSGQVVWAEARAQRAETRASARLMARLTAGICGGTLVSLALLFPMAQWIAPLAPGHEGSLLKGAFALVLAIAMAWAWRGTPGGAAARLLFLAGIACLLIPASDVLQRAAGGPWPQGEAVAVDAVALLAGGLLLALARALGRRLARMHPGQLWN